MQRLLGYQKVRFVLVGIFNTGLDFILLNLMVFFLGTYPLIANTISVSIGITVSYVLNHKFVFRHTEPLTWKKYFMFFVVSGFSSLILQNLIIWLFEELGNSQFGHSIIFVETLASHDALRLNVAKITAVLVGMVWNFMLYKYFIFKKPDQDTNTAD